MVSNHHVLRTHVTAIAKNPNNNELSFTETVDPLLDADV
jgi:hypothetical protein